MAKTRRKHINRSPGRAFRNSTTYVAVTGDTVTTIGVRGRTVVKFVGGKRVRVTEAAVQTPAKAVGDRQPRGIFVGRTYTGVARSKPYPYLSTKRGAPAITLKPGLMSRMGKAMKKVVTNV